ncbi:MAG: response regulator [Verrucomicrobia bacterium]|nr:response regulator [Verrucomicrobiota bacterium]
MTKPLGLFLYENLMPGSQLANRLQDLGYRVQVVGDARLLVSQAIEEKPMLVVIDLACQRVNVCDVIKELRQNPATSHMPVLAFTNHSNTAMQTAAREAGATLVAAEEAMLVQLPQLLDQVLEIE